MPDKEFANLLGGDVEPLNIEQRVAVDQQRDAKNVSLGQRRARAQDETQTTDPLASEPVNMLEPMSVLSYVRPGVQHGVFKNLRLGKYAPDARLDLHRLTVEQARLAVYRFVQDCVEQDIRTTLITHGKGEGRQTPALLKSCVAHWLPQLDEVLAFHTAQRHHGGYGATYVLLKKSRAKSLQNKESYLNRKK